MFFCDSIKKHNPQVLELACGPGNITKYLLNKRNDLQILATDLAPNMLELAKFNNPLATFQLLDAKEIVSLNKKFDAIMSSFCLPYLSKKEALNFINDCNSILNDDGVLYISTMEDDNSKSGLYKSSKGDEMYMNFHESDYLIACLLENEFNILHIERQETELANSSKTTDLIMVCQK